METEKEKKHCCETFSEYLNDTQEFCPICNKIIEVDPKRAELIKEMLEYYKRRHHRNKRLKALYYLFLVCLLSYIFYSHYW